MDIMLRRNFLAIAGSIPFVRLLKKRKVFLEFRNELWTGKAGQILTLVNAKTGECKWTYWEPDIDAIFNTK